MEQRRFHRVKFSAPGELKHHEMKYRCRLENISLRGALISADECIMVPLNETCTLSVSIAPECEPVVITVCVVHCFFSMVGVSFVAFTGDAEKRILELLRGISAEPEKLREEWEGLQRARPAQGEDAPAEQSAAAW